MKYIKNVLCHRLVFKFTLINAFSILIIALAFPSNLVNFNLSSAMGFEQGGESRDTMANQSSLKQLTNPTSVHVDRHTLHTHDNDDTIGYHSMKFDSDTGIETKNKNNWITVNHDIYSTRSSNQTIISKENVSQLKVKWTLFKDRKSVV